MNALYHQTNELLKETQHIFIKLEKCTDQEVAILERDIQNRIETITR